MMPAYLFEAMDASGSEVRDQVDAANEAAAQRELRARGYFVTRLHKVSSGSVRNESESDVERRNVVCRDDSAKLAEETSRCGRRESPRRLWYVWSSLFLIVGCFFCYELGVRPLWRVWQASGWVETPCTVISSKLKEHHSTEPSEPTYSTEIVYKYEFRGSQYQSDRYDFVTMSSNTNVAMRSGIVKAHPPGKQTVCFVNPASPAEAVLARGWTSEMLWGLFPIPFVLIGVFGLLLCTGVLRFNKKPRSE